MVLEVDVAMLWKHGRITLPNIAGAYAGATQSLNRAESGTENPTSRTAAEDGMGAMGRIYGPWASLRDELHSALADNADVLQQTGSALVLAAKSYGFTDDDNATNLRKLVHGDLWRDPDSAGEYQPPKLGDINVQRPGDEPTGKAPIPTEPEKSGLEDPKYPKPPPPSTTPNGIKPWGS